MHGANYIELTYGTRINMVAQWYECQLHIDIKLVRKDMDVNEHEQGAAIYCSFYLSQPQKCFQQ